MRPKKHLSQNFLIDEQVIERCISYLKLEHPASILEIGPGRGAFTEKLSGTEVVLVEKDSALIPELRKRFSHFTVHEGDILAFAMESLPAETKVISNLPFHLTSPILSLLVTTPQISEVHVIVQEEMARRICAQPGDKEMSLLTLYLANFSTAHYRFKISRSAFYPVPKVDCGFISLYPKSPLIPKESTEPFFEFLHAPFQQKRKMLRSSMKEFLGSAEKLGIETTLRPEALSLEQWYRWYQAIDHSQR